MAEVNKASSQGGRGHVFAFFRQIFLFEEKVYGTGSAGQITFVSSVSNLLRHVHKVKSKKAANMDGEQHSYFVKP